MKSEEVYYHGTSTENFIEILKGKLISQKYFDENGCFITNNLLGASNFGEIVFCFDAKTLHKENFMQDDVNDGIFYKGGIFLSDFKVKVFLDGRIQKKYNYFFELMTMFYKKGGCINLLIKDFKVIGIY